MSLSLLVFLAQDIMIALGKIVEKIIDINSKTGNSHKLSMDNVKQIIRNNGMHMMGGFVKVEIVLANLNFVFILYNITITLY